MRSNPFRGYGVALVTPFVEGGAVDYESLERLVDFQLNNEVDFICAMGTTAETPVLEPDEYEKVLSFIVKKVNGRVPVMAGCSDNCTSRLVRKLQNMPTDGLQGVLICTPSYNKPSQEGIYRHFMAAAEVSKLPIVLYNVPGRTGVNMTAETTLRLAAASDKFIAVKEASGNVEQINELIDNVPTGFGVISGDDSLTFQLVQRGAVGVISVIGNVIPGVFGRMVHAVANGNLEEAATLHSSMIRLYPLLFKEGNPSGVKAVMADRGMLKEVLRLPLVPVSNELRKELLTGFADKQ